MILIRIQVVWDVIGERLRISKDILRIQIFRAFNKLEIIIFVFNGIRLFRSHF